MGGRWTARKHTSTTDQAWHHEHTWCRDEGEGEPPADVRGPGPVPWQAVQICVGDIAAWYFLSPTWGCSLKKLLFTHLPAVLNTCDQCLSAVPWREGQLSTHKCLGYLCFGYNLAWSAS